MSYESNVEIVNDSARSGNLHCNVTVDEIEYELWDNGDIYIEDVIGMTSVESLTEIIMLSKMFKYARARYVGKIQKVVNENNK